MSCIHTAQPTQGIDLHCITTGYLSSLSISEDKDASFLHIQKFWLAHLSSSVQKIHWHICKCSRVLLQELRYYLCMSLHFDRVVQQPHIHQSAHSCNQWCSQHSQEKYRKYCTLCVDACVYEPCQ